VDEAAVAPRQAPAGHSKEDLTRWQQEEQRRIAEEAGSHAADAAGRGASESAWYDALTRWQADCASLCAQRSGWMILL
jgi:hypothetical protein